MDASRDKRESAGVDLAESVGDALVVSFDGGLSVVCDVVGEIAGAVIGGIFDGI
ncbi:MAG TPA: hypothetical protein VMZ26_02665 [Pyrinomonadaceae bacterium]|nr:hypothetical protein [Pyrinomonadaceae bacterium]